MFLQDARYGFWTQRLLSLVLWPLWVVNFCIGLLFQVLRSCYYLICNDVEIGVVTAGTCPFFQFSTTSTSAVKTLVVLGSSTTKPIARHPWGTHRPPSRKKTKRMSLSNPQTQLATSHASLYLREKKCDHIFCSPNPPSMSHINTSQNSWLKVSPVWVLTLWACVLGRINHCQWNLRFAHSTSFFQNSGTFYYVWAAVITGTGWQNIFLEHSGPSCFSISISSSKGRCLLVCIDSNHACRLGPVTGLATRGQVGTWGALVSDPESFLDCCSTVPCFCCWE